MLKSYVANLASTTLSENFMKNNGEEIMVDTLRFCRNVIPMSVQIHFDVMIIN